VKLLVDMNLSPSWIERLARHGFEAVHWSTTGAATAPDSEILTWANEHGFVLITNDLDFSAVLAASAQARRRRLSSSRSELRICSLTRS
jgi:predicted nuclease of predicted toxin-antitoxin system